MGDTGYRELRLAVVCYGGVSLAIYMHGLTKELHQLVIASAEHEPDYKGTAETTGTSPVYHDLLKRLQELEGDDAPRTRVLTDIIAGTSAGGMNGVCLARAVAGDRSQESLTEAWLAEAGIGQLLAPQLTAELPSGRRVYPHLKRVYPPVDVTTPPEDLPPRAGRLGLAWHGLWSAAYSIRPAIRLAGNFPPSALDGSKMTTLVTNALHGMQAREGGIGCLLPGEHPLDLYVTTTDFSGAAQLVPIEHRLVGDTRFRTVLHFESGRAGVTFPLDGDEHVPMICFAARATASFPGAFPPISLDTFDANTSWDDLVKHFFRQYMLDGEKPVDVRARRFFDGGVLDNWPFDHAIKAIGQRSADCEVDRRLLYLEPDPAAAVQPGAAPPGAPGMFAAFKRGASDIPLSQSLGDALSGLRERNEKVAELKALVDDNRDRIERSVMAHAQRPDAGRRGRWRGRVGPSAAGAARRAAGRRRLPPAQGGAGAGRRCDAHVRHAQLPVHLAARLAGAPDLAALGCGAGPVPARRRRLGHPEADRLPARLRRRLRGAAAALHDRRHQPALPQLGRAAAGELNATKALVYDRLRTLSALTVGTLADPAVITGTTEAFGEDSLHKAVSEGDVDDQIDALTEERADQLTALRDHLQPALTAALDPFGRETFAQLRTSVGKWTTGNEHGQALLARYLGFPLWDQLTYAITLLYGVGERDRVEVVRMSPRESRLGDEFGSPDERLTGTGVHHFGAFFSAKGRENDYLWGRLDGAQQLIEVLIGRAPQEQRNDLRTEFYRRAFAAILDVEKQRLTTVGALIDKIGDKAEAFDPNTVTAQPSAAAAASR